MKTVFLFVLILFVAACGNKADEYQKPTSDIDAFRSFVGQSLKGHFNTAQKYMLPDTENIQWLEQVTKDYNQRSAQEKAGLSTASINIAEVAPVNDTVTVISFSNSYFNKPQKVKVIKRNNEWWVDFKYTFSGNL
jgi:type IV secretory pathway component VirB8